MKRKADVSEIKKAVNYRTYKQGDVGCCAYCKYFVMKNYYCEKLQIKSGMYDTCDEYINWREK